MSEKISKNWLLIVLIVICVSVILVIAVIAIVGLNDSEDGNNDSASLDLNENEVPDLDDEYDPDSDSDLSLSELNVILASGISAEDKLAELEIFIVNNGYESVACHNELSDGLYSTVNSKEALDYLNNLQSLPLALMPYVEDLKGLVNDNSVTEESLAQVHQLQLKHQVIDHLSESDAETGTVIEPSRTCKYDIAGLEI